MQEPPWMPRTEAEYRQQLAEDAGPHPDEMVRFQQELDAADEEIARLKMVRDAAEREIQRLRATAITFTCYECGEFFDEPIQSFLSESGALVLAPTLCADCGEGVEE